MVFRLKSHAFADGSAIPEVYTCDGRSISPPLSWEDVPAGTQQYALILEDPDAPRGVYDHWLLYGLPADITSLSEYVENGESGPSGSKQGRNSAGQLGYSGPCPPFGHGAHRYVFNLYALDTPLTLRAGETKDRLLRAMGDHVIAVTQLMGTYERRPPSDEPKGKARHEQG